MLSAQAKLIQGVETHYLYRNDDDDEEDDDDVEADEAAVKAAAESTAAERRRRAESVSALGAGVAAEKAELMAWSPKALLHNLTALGATGAEGKSKAELVERYYAALEATGSAKDEAARRWLHVPKGSSEEASAKIWIGALLNIELEAGPLQQQLRSGEMLCEMVNVVSPGLIEKVARAELLALMPESRRNARMRENIGLFVDACAELGVPQRDLFLTAELFEGKNWKSVLRAIHSLARRAHADIPGFHGPHIGIRKSGGGNGGGGPSLVATASRKGAHEEGAIDAPTLSTPTSTRL